MKARLSKDGLRVLCGKPTGCTGGFGTVKEQPFGSGGPGERARLFEYPPGWVRRENDVYELSAYAQRRYERQAPARLKRGFAGALGGHWHQLPRHPELPAVFRCPVCKWLNSIEAEPLQLTHPFHSA